MEVNPAHTARPRPSAERKFTPDLTELARLVRAHILKITTHAGSGHPTSSLSATDLMTSLLFGGTFRFAVEDPKGAGNDRLIFSKGHASPLLYALWLAADQVSEDEIQTYREFGSPFEGHPTPRLDFIEAATGSLGQGLSIGLGMALNAKYIDRLGYRTYVLLGDSEMTEGSQWEAMELAAHYKLNNLVGIIDVNRLGQRGATIHGHDCAALERRVSAFGWDTLQIDGHDFGQIEAAFQKAKNQGERPTMIVARTIKGKGVSFLEDHEGWHGKALDEEQLDRALKELGPVSMQLRGRISRPEPVVSSAPPPEKSHPESYALGEKVATRTAYGKALLRLAPLFPNLVALDAEVSNSTKVEPFAQRCEGRFFEMYIAEQNMVGAAIGLAQRGKIPFVSTFAAFMTRAFDQIRMAAYSNANIKFVGSHSGAAIGPDGPSQMGLEDIAMFRAIHGSVVLHPADAVAADRLFEQVASSQGIVYVRTMRQKTKVIYDENDHFAIGRSHVLRKSDRDVCCIVAAGATVHEALSAHETLAKEGISVRVIDAYSIKPLDVATLHQAAEETRFLVTVEDHYPEGGLGEAVLAALRERPTPVFALAVFKRPKSGPGETLLDYEGISANAIVSTIRKQWHTAPRDS